MLIQVIIVKTVIAVELVDKPERSLVSQSVRYLTN